MYLNQDFAPIVAEPKQEPTIRIDKVVVYHETDTFSDLSWIGKYSDYPGPADRTIDRVARGHVEPSVVDREYRYFIAAMSGDETKNPESVEEDYQRMEAYNRGAWHMLGIYAVAVVSYDIGHGSRRQESLRSDGLWGVESDSDEIDNNEQEQLASLRGHLVTFGVDVSEFDTIAAKADRRTK
jgi:hypothetical protein